MSNRKAPAGCYWRGETLWGRVKVNGRQVRWSLQTSDPKVARERRAAGKSKLIAAAKFGDDRKTFVEVMTAWAGWIVRQVGAETVQRYTVSLAQLETFLAGKHIDEINGKLVADIIAGRQDVDGVTNATIKRDLVALSSVMNFCIDRGWIEANPVLPRMKRLKERRDPIVLPRPEDVEAVIAKAPGMFATLIRAAWVTGAREEELAGGRASQLDLDAKRLTVLGKGNKRRVIDLEPFGGVEVFASLPPAVAKAPLFRHHAGKRYSKVSARFGAIRDEVAETDKDFTPFRFHDLRHLHAVEWLRSGRSIYDLQKRLGHASIKTTEIYLAFLTPEEARIAKGEVSGGGTKSDTNDQDNSAEG